MQGGLNNMNMHIPLFENYSLQIASESEEFMRFLSQHRPIVFAKNVDLNLNLILDEDEKGNKPDAELRKFLSLDSQ